ncbi:uncharacterized protein LOC112500640 [Cynara cardunculus var. scolymus]|uniref:uncharacterized protein LOC112500640 n=1 Tax=Cynara cardunculus var. scolymus TaxID=59895 RepID=UPI000D62DBE3|nr:uncharacterized protein LOC112500640 [Cynara cardunculus var. scolymus]
MDSAGAGYGNMKKFAVVEYYSKIWNYHDEAAAQKQQPRLAVLWDQLEKLSRGRRGREPEDRNRRAEPETEKESRTRSIEREQDGKLSRRREQDRKPIGRGIDQKSTAERGSRNCLLRRSRDCRTRGTRTRNREETDLGRYAFGHSCNEVGTGLSCSISAEIYILLDVKFCLLLHSNLNC